MGVKKPRLRAQVPLTYSAFEHLKRILRLIWYGCQGWGGKRFSTPYSPCVKLYARLANALFNLTKGKTMTKDTKLELLKMATQLAAAAMAQNRVHTKGRDHSVEGTFNDCLAAITAAYNQEPPNSLAG